MVFIRSITILFIASILLLFDLLWIILGLPVLFLFCLGYNIAWTGNTAFIKHLSLLDWWVLSNIGWWDRKEINTHTVKEFLTNYYLQVGHWKTKHCKHRFILMVVFGLSGNLFVIGEIRRKEQKVKRIRII